MEIMKKKKKIQWLTADYNIFLKVVLCEICSLGFPNSAHITFAVPNRQNPYNSHASEKVDTAACLCKDRNFCVITFQFTDSPVIHLS